MLVFIPEMSHTMVISGYIILEKNTKKILIQPMIGQYKKGEFKEKSLIDTNKIAVQISGKNSIFASFFLIQDMLVLESLFFMQLLEKIMVVLIF